MSDEASGLASALETVEALERWMAGHWADWLAWMMDSRTAVTKAARMDVWWAEKLADHSGQTTAAM